MTDTPYRRLNQQDTEDYLRQIKQQIEKERSGSSSVNSFLKRLNALITLVAQPSLNLQLIYSIMFPNTKQETARVQFTNFKNKLNKIAKQHEFSIELEVDSSRKLDLKDRLCWFNGIPLSGKRVDDYNRSVSQPVHQVETIHPRIKKEPGDPDDASYKVFVSVATKDFEQVEDLVSRLQPYLSLLQKEVHFWFFKKELRMGDYFDSKIQQAIQGCDFGLLALSQYFFFSNYIKNFELPWFVPQNDSDITACKFASPILIRRLDFENHDLKGINGIQIFQGTNETPYMELQSEAEKDKWAKELADEISKILDEYDANSNRNIPVNEELLPLSIAFENICKQHGYNQDEFIQTRATEYALGENTDEHENTRGIDALEFLSKWAGNPESRPYCALLGEYGMGKTFTSMMLAEQLAEQRQKNPDTPLTYYLDLRRFSEGYNLKQDQLPELDEILKTTLQRSYHASGIETPDSDEIIDNVRNQGALVIFDGLDEVMVHLTDSQNNAFIRQLWSILPPVMHDGTTQRGKVMLTCRSHFFSTVKQEASMLTGQGREGIDKQTYHALTLLPFTKKQIREYFEKNLPDTNPDEVMELLASVHDLSDLARRPYSLNLISSQMQKLEQQRAKGKTIRAINLYQNLIEEWVQRDSGKHQFDPEHKPRLMEALAAELWQRKTRQLPFTEVAEWLDEYFHRHPAFAGAYANKDRNLLKEDLRTATFIIRKDAKQFQFAHSSLAEYFLAAYLFRALEKGNLEAWAIPLPSKETLVFLGELFIQANNNNAKQNLNTLLVNAQQQRSELAFRFWLLCKNAGYPVLQPKRFDLSNADLSDLDISLKSGEQLFLNRADFSHAKLRRTVFKRVQLNQAIFNKADARQAEFHDCQLSQALCEQTNFEVSIWRNSALTQLSLKNARLESSKWISNELAEVELPEDYYKKVLFADPARPPARPLILKPASNLGHSSRVNSIAFNHDGTRVVSSADDSSVKLWDANSGDCLLTLQGHSAPVNSVAFNHEGSRIVSASHDRSIKLWDANSGDCLLTLQGHSVWVNSVTFNHDGSRIVSASRDRSVKLWDANSGDCLLTLQEHSAPVNSVAFNHDSSRIVSAVDDDCVKLWDANSGDCLLTLQGHSAPVTSVAFNHDGSRIVSAARDRSIKLWNANSGDCLLTLQGHSAPVTSVAFNQIGSRIVSAARDCSVKLWDVNSGDCLSTLQGHSNSVKSVAFNHDGYRIVSAADDRSIKLWDVNSGDCLLTLQGHSDWVNSVAFNHDGSRVASAASYSGINLWDANSGNCLLTLQGHSAPATSVAFNHDGSRIVSAAHDRSIKLWDANSGDCLSTIQVHSAPVNSVAFNHDGSRVVSTAGDRSIRLWDANSGDCLLTLQGHSDWVTSVAFNHDGCRIVSAAEDRSVKLWDVNSGDCLLTLQGHSGPAASVAFNHDGSRVVSAARDHSIKLWNANSGDCLLTLQGHSAPVNSVAFNHDGSRVVSAAEDRSVKLWDVNSVDCLLTLQGHSAPVNSVAFNHDGSRVVSAAGDSSIKLWDVKTGQCLQSLLQLPQYETASIDHINNTFSWASAGAWRYLGWQATNADSDENTYARKLLLAETFGPLPGPDSSAR